MSSKEEPAKLSSAGNCILGTSPVNHEGPDLFITMTRLDTTVYSLSRLTIVASPAGKVTMLIDKPLDKLELRPTSDKCDEYVTTPIELYHVKAYVGQDEDLQNTLKDIVRSNPFLRHTSVGVLVQGVIEEYPIKPNELVRIRCKRSVEIYPNKKFNIISLLNQIRDENKEKERIKPMIKKSPKFYADIKTVPVDGYDVPKGMYTFGREMERQFLLSHAHFVITQDHKVFLIKHYVVDATIKKGSKFSFQLDDLFLVTGTLDHIQEDQLNGNGIYHVYGLIPAKRSNDNEIPSYLFEVVSQSGFEDLKSFARLQNQPRTTSPVSDKEDSDYTINLGDPESWKKVVANLHNINYGRKAQDFILSCLHRSPTMLIRTEDVKFLLDMVNRASDGSDEKVLRFIRIFEKLGFMFQYTSKLGWVLLEPPSHTFEVPGEADFTVK